MSLPQSIPLPGHVRCLHPRQSGVDVHRRGEVCSFCFADALVPLEAKAQPKDGTVIPVPKQRPGSIMEQAMLAALLGAGYVRDLDFIAQYHWSVDEGRNHAADFGFPKQRVLVECDGGVHSINRNREKDCEKASLASALGWRVVRVHRKMIEDGSALALTKRALEYGRIS